MSDGELAAAFAKEQLPDAFDELVRRHAAMVYRVCRRLTHDHHDAEDAMQAVFVALADRAGLLGGSGSLAGWLYGTSWHIASRVNRSRVTRTRREQQACGVPVEQSSPSWLEEEHRRELYRAIHMLPPDYRDAIVLHHLQGMAVAEVADITGWSIGTTASRLSRGRAMMRERLARRGVELPLAAFSAMLLAETAMELSAPPVALPAAWAPPVAASAVSNLTTAGTCASSAAIGANTAVKWALAACVTMSVGGGSVAAFRAVTPEKPRKGAGETRFAEVSTTLKSTFAGMVEDTEEAPLFGARRTSSGSSVVPEPAGLSFLALAALTLRRRRR